MSDEITLDGAAGEGGGQILRSALALSLVTGRPFRIESIRARREKPGLRRQHLTAVDAAARLGGAVVSGNALGSRELRFSPGPVVPGAYTFDVGTAGGGSFHTLRPTPHTLTNAEVIRQFLPCRITAEYRDGPRWEITVSS